MPTPSEDLELVLEARVSDADPLALYRERANRIEAISRLVTVTNKIRITGGKIEPADDDRTRVSLFKLIAPDLLRRA